MIPFGKRRLAGEYGIWPGPAYDLLYGVGEEQGAGKGTEHDKSEKWSGSGKKGIKAGFGHLFIISSKPGGDIEKEGNEQ